MGGMGGGAGGGGGGNIPENCLWSDVKDQTEINAKRD